MVMLLSNMRIPLVKMAGCGPLKAAHFSEKAADKDVDSAVKPALDVHGI